MPLNLHEHLSFTPEEVLKIFQKEFPPKFFIEPERSGLRRRVSSEHGNAIQKHHTALLGFEMYNPQSDRLEINYGEAVKFSGWMDHDYSLPALIRIKLSLNPHYIIPRQIRWALQIYETTIKRQGAIRGSTGHTVLPLNYLIAQITSQWPLGWHTHNTLHDEDKDGICYSSSQARELLEQFVKEGYLAYTESQTCVYVPEYAATEMGLISYLSTPKTPETLENLPETLDNDQKTAVRAIIERTTVGACLAGYPGTGKTYTCKTLCDHYGVKKVLALATTGAAAMVLARQLNCDAYTISTAYYNAGNESFSKIWARPVYIVDECSMLNMSFLQQLLSLLNTFKPITVLLVGDPAQLPPVGAGAFFEALVDHKIYSSIPIHVLTHQHRMDAASAIRLQQFNYSISPGVAAESQYPKYHTPSLADDVNCPLLNIFKFCLAGAPVAKKTITERNMATPEDRLLMSTYRGGDADILNTFLESYRCRSLPEVDFLRKHLETDIEKYVTLIDNTPVDKFPRILEKQTPGYIHKYIANFLLNNIDKIKPGFGDDIEALEACIATNYKALKEALQPHLFLKGGYLRCKTNGWFRFWSSKRAAAMEQEWGIHVRDKQSIANGQIFVAIEDNLLYCAESNVTVDIRNPGKASHLFPISWVSTTHKLQGDQGAVSLLFLLNPSIETKLVYVAKSRGKIRNIIIQNITSSQACWMEKNLRIAASVDRLSIAAYLSDQKVKAAA